MQRVVDLPERAHVSADRRVTEVNEPAAGTAASSVTQECRRLAELLRLDVVGVVSSARGERRVALWSDPGAPAPADLDDVLEGRAEGWIVCHLPGGDAAVFARTSSGSAEGATDVLRAVGPSLAAEVANLGVPPRPDLTSMPQPESLAGPKEPARS